MKKLFMFLCIVIMIFGFVGCPSDNDDPCTTSNIVEKVGLDNDVIPRTGQTESYYDYDDGDLQMGIPWPVPRFTDNEDGTVTDNLTHLMWTKDAQQIPETMDWYDAVDACNDLIFADSTDWYLPNIRELQSLIDYGETWPALPSGHPFTNVQLATHWSSTTDALGTGNAWFVDIPTGNLGYHNKPNTLRVWCVRGGL